MAAKKPAKPRPGEEILVAAETLRDGRRFVLHARVGASVSPVGFGTLEQVRQLLPDPLIARVAQAGLAMRSIEPPVRDIGPWYEEEGDGGTLTLAGWPHCGFVPVLVPDAVWEAGRPLRAKN